MRTIGVPAGTRASPARPRQPARASAARARGPSTRAPRMLEKSTAKTRGRPARGALEMPAKSERLTEVQLHAPAEDPRAEALEDQVGVRRRQVALHLQDGLLVEQVETVQAQGQAELVEAELLFDPRVD